MAILPSTGSEIAMGRVHKAYTNKTPGVAPAAQPDGSGGSTDIKLSAVLGAGSAFGAQAAPAGSQVSLSSTFGGDTTQHDY
jgi:hypothetical protein